MIAHFTWFLESWKFMEFKHRLLKGMSQNPFEAGQTERTPEEQKAFLSAIAALPEAVQYCPVCFTWKANFDVTCFRELQNSMSVSQLCQVFFTADAVLHVEGEWPALDVEKTTHRVPSPV